MNILTIKILLLLLKLFKFFIQIFLYLFLNTLIISNFTFLSGANFGTFGSCGFFAWFVFYFFEFSLCLFFASVDLLFNRFFALICSRFSAFLYRSFLVLNRTLFFRNVVCCFSSLKKKIRNIDFHICS